GEKQDCRHQGHDWQLKDMCRRAFVRLGRLSVPAKYRKQRCKRQDDYDFAAKTVDLLPTHGVTSFSACWSPLRFAFAIFPSAAYPPARVMLLNHPIIDVDAERVI